MKKNPLKSNFIKFRSGGGGVQAHTIGAGHKLAWDPGSRVPRSSGGLCIKLPLDEHLGPPKAPRWAGSSGVNRHLITVR